MNSLRKSGRDRAPVPLPEVLEIGDLALDELVVKREHRQLPGLFAGALGGTFGRFFAATAGHN